MDGGFRCGRQGSGWDRGPLNEPRGPQCNDFNQLSRCLPGALSLRLQVTAKCNSTGILPSSESLRRVHHSGWQPRRSFHWQRPRAEKGSCEMHQLIGQWGATSSLNAAPGPRAARGLTGRSPWTASDRSSRRYAGKVQLAVARLTRRALKLEAPPRTSIGPARGTFGVATVRASCQCH